MNAALTRFRIMAWITGISLLVLVFFIMPVRYIGGDARPSHVFSPFHGLMYFLYVITVFDLLSRMRWGIGRIVLLMLAGCIPFVSFIGENKVTVAARAMIAERAERSAATQR